MRECVARMRDQLRFVGGRAGLQRDEGNRHFAPFLIGAGDHRGFHHRRMRRQRAFDFERRDVLAAGNDNVFRAVLDFDVTIRMHDAQIAGAEPAVGCRASRRFIVAIVAEHHVVAAQGDFTEGRAVGRHVMSFVVDDAQLLRDHVADSLARLDASLLVDRQFAPVAAPLAYHGRAEGFGEAVEMRHIDAELRHAREYRRRRWRAPGCGVDRAREPAVFCVVGPCDHDEHGRRRAEMRDTGFAQVPPDQRGFEFAQAQVGRTRRGDAPRKAPAVAVKHRQRPQVRAVAIEPHVRHHRERLQVRTAVVIHHALGFAGGAARVVDGEHPALVGDGLHVRRRIREPSFVFIVAAGAHELQRAAGSPCDVARDGFQLMVVDEYLRVAVLDDVGEFTRREALIERDQHHARQRHAVVRFEEHVGIGREHGRPRAIADAQRAQRAGKPLRARVKLGIGIGEVAVDDRDTVGEHRRRTAQECGRRQRLEGHVALHQRTLLSRFT